MFSVRSQVCRMWHHLVSTHSQWRDCLVRRFKVKFDTDGSPRDSDGKLVMRGVNGKT